MHGSVSSSVRRAPAVHGAGRRPRGVWEEAIPEDVRSKLRSYGFQLRDEPFERGNSQGIPVRDDGSYVGVADARRSEGVEGPE